MCIYGENTTLAYKSVGVYGKVSGTLTGMCSLGGIVAFVEAIVPSLRGNSSVFAVVLFFWLSVYYHLVLCTKNVPMK